jgi:hypothetical protein
MNMIGDSADAFSVEPILLCDATYIGPQALSDIWVQHRHARLCAEDAVNA